MATIMSFVLWNGEKEFCRGAEYLAGYQDHD